MAPDWDEITRLRFVTDGAPHGPEFLRRRQRLTVTTRQMEAAMIGTLLVSVGALVIAILGRALIGTTDDRISDLRRRTDPLFRQAGIALDYE